MDRLSIADVGSEACSVATAIHPPSSSSSAAQLPWWKLILVDKAYRARVMQLATRSYRQELRLLQRAPEQLSSAAGKKEEGGTVKVMAQYVRVESGELFSLNHPRAIVKHSTLATRLQAALCTMPPVQNKKERQQQMRAIEAQFRQRRRYSLQHAPTQRICDARAILNGQTTLDEVRCGGQRGPYLLSQAELARRRQLYHAWRVRMRSLYKETNYYAVARYKLQEEQRCGGFGQARPLLLPLLSKEEQELYVFPAPSPNARRRRVQIIHHGLPPETTSSNVNLLRRGNDAIEKSRSARSLLDSSDSDTGSIDNNSLFVKNYSDNDENSSSSDDSDADPKTSAMVAEYRRHAALACVDGTDNLYGLSYFWKLPLPPAGFIRVSPDPRQAMWPSEQLEAKRQAQAERRRRDMQSLMHKVNERNRRIMTLRQYGCHITINMLRDSSDDEVGGEANKVTDGALAVPSRTNGNDSVEEEWRELLIGPARGNTTTTTAAQGNTHVSSISRHVQSSSTTAMRQASQTANDAAEDMDQDIAHILRPLHEGPLNINVVVVDADGAAQRKLFLGTFRQSKLLVHYKIYCRALHAEVEHRAEQRLRRKHDANSANSKEDEEESIVNDAALLAGVPVIPFPVLRVQQGSPPLRRPDRLHTPDLSHVQPARCWEGLIVCPPPYRTTTAQHVWRYLHAVSAMTQQAVRDVFDCLTLDQEGRLQRHAYIEFVLDLLNLFFPTHLHQVHRAIAEEEWVYRGCSETVAFPTFYEHFFSFPFIFMRDVATMTEQAYVEFWSLVRICLFENDPLPPVLPCRVQRTKSNNKKTENSTESKQVSEVKSEAVTSGPQDSLHVEDAHNRTLVYSSLTAHEATSLAPQQTSLDKEHAPQDLPTTPPFTPTPAMSCSLSISAQNSSRPTNDTTSLPLSTVTSSQHIAAQRELHHYTGSKNTYHKQQQRPSLLVPLSGFTERQIAALYRHRYRNDDKYTLYCVMAELAEHDPIVRQLPESRRYRVLLDRACKQLQKKEAQQQLQQQSDVLYAEKGHMVPTVELQEEEVTNSTASATSPHVRNGPTPSPSLPEPKGTNTSNNKENAQPFVEDAMAPHVLPYRAITLGEQSHEDEATGLALHGHLDEAESVSRRSKLAFATERRRAQLRRREEERRRAFLLANSLWYQSRHRRQQSRHDTTLTGIESLSSNYELFEDDVFYLAPPTDDAEDALIHYIRDVDEEVFRGNISLRERYMVSEAYKRERVRQHHALHDKATTGSNNEEHNIHSPAEQGDNESGEGRKDDTFGAEAFDTSSSTPTTTATMSMLSFTGLVSGHGHMPQRELDGGALTVKNTTTSNGTVKTSRLTHRVVHFAHDTDGLASDEHKKADAEEAQKLPLPTVEHNTAGKDQSTQESLNTRPSEGQAGAPVGDDDESSVYARVPSAVRGLLTQLATEDTTMPWRTQHKHTTPTHLPDVTSRAAATDVASRDALRRLRCRQQRERTFVQQRLSGRSGTGKGNNTTTSNTQWAGYNVFRRDTIRL